MGGLGKTTLAKKVYTKDVKGHFDCYYWAFISQQFSTKDVLLEILRKVVPDEERRRLERVKVEELIETLYRLLKEKKYLVVLDDIWSTEAWHSLKYAFPKEKKGSKILFTTRYKEVALSADPRSTPIEPPFLTDEEGWTLLSKKAFVGQQTFPLEFEDMGKQMVKKCGGLPLAVAVLGGLLARKKSVNDWEIVQRNINVQFSKLQQGEGYGGVYEILGLSYHDLPFHLKPCFLYLSQFPEDWEIHKRKLIRMWIAEGFVSQPLNGGGDETMEDLGEEYLEELISRCMVQVSQIDHTGRGVKTCRIHDLMRDLCVEKARQENFLQVIQHQENASTSANSSPYLPQLGANKRRRIAIHQKYQAGRVHLHDNLAGTDSHLRSLLYFADEYGMNKGSLGFNNFRLLRVLKLRYVRDLVFREIGNLIHLRHLGLRDCDLIILPNSIGNLRSLYTLDLGGSRLGRPPNELWKLECLRHLLVPGNGMYFRIDTLRHLETLKRIEAKNLIRKNALLTLTNLRNLEILFREKEEVESVLNSPNFTLDHLRSVRLHSDMGFLFSNLEPISRCHHLTKLLLSGEIGSYMRSPCHKLEFLPTSLTKLVLSKSRLMEDPMVVLEKLPNLRYLSLDGAYNGTEIVCSAHGFPQLETLELQWLDNLEEWRVEEGAIPCLKNLDIAGLRKLRMIPEGLKCVTTLRELTLYAMPGEFQKRAQVIEGIEGEDFYKVKHIPTISIGPD